MVTTLRLTKNSGLDPSDPIKCISYASPWYENFKGHSSVGYYLPRYGWDHHQWFDGAIYYWDGQHKTVLAGRGVNVVIELDTEAFESRLCFRHKATKSQTSLSTQCTESSENTESHLAELQRSLESAIETRILASQKNSNDFAHNNYEVTRIAPAIAVGLIALRRLYPKSEIWLGKPSAWEPFERVLCKNLAISFCPQPAPGRGARISHNAPPYLESLLPKAPPRIWEQLLGFLDQKQGLVPKDLMQTGSKG